jgi:hypothetical protein
MVKSVSAPTSHFSRGILAFAVLALVFGVGFHWHFLSRVDAQQLVKSAAKGPAAVAMEDVKPASATDIFLQLATSVGQTAPAKRLIDYKQKNDPSSKQRFYAIVDFDLPSTSKRLFVFDTVDKKVESYYVAHGRGSGENVAERFSNAPGSFSSSLGIYKTMGEYNGHHGRSLRLEGLEPTNSNALSRAVVMHTADYMSEAFIRQTGRLGRSEGCFAVERSALNTLVDELKGGAFIIASKS